MTKRGEQSTGLLALVLDELRTDDEARANLRRLLADEATADAGAGRTAYTVDTLAAELDVTPRAVRAWISSGELPAVKRAGRWVIAAATVEAWSSPDSPTARRTQSVRRRSSSNRSPLRDAFNSMKDAA